MSGIDGLEVVDLALQVFFLVCAANSGVDDAFRFIPVFHGMTFDSEGALEVVDAVESLSICTISYTSYCPIVSPSPKSCL